LPYPLQIGQVSLKSYNILAIALKENLFITDDWTALFSSPDTCTLKLLFCSFL